MDNALVRAMAAMAAAASLHREGRLKDAEAAYRRVLTIDPANADAMNMLGLVLHARGDGETAVQLMRASIAIRSTGSHWYNLGTVLESRGDIPVCLAAFRQASALEPGDAGNWSPAIFNGDLHPFSTPEVRLSDRRAFNQVHCAALTAAAPPHTNDPDPDRKLRVGYLSADFVDHSAGMVFEPVLAGHDRSAVEVYLYWQQRQTADAHTERFRGYADHWREISSLSDEALAARMRADGIDVLVDLAGYSNGHRLTALARKPAPIIMTGWGHVTGLGTDFCDYLLADEVTVPPEAEWQHHERVLRLPCILAFDPRPPYPDVSVAPAERNGYTTFGYLGRATKTSEPVWAAWAAILNRVPDSRLLLKGREYVDASYRARIVEFFASLRVSSRRIDFRGASSRQQHLDTYADIDVALDVWPQNSGVTTLEACLMGVPTVSLLGNHLNGRIGASILATIGRQQWVGLSTDHYIEVAAALGQARHSLTARMALRDDLIASIICNPAEYARAAEGLYRQAWQAWCAEQQPAHRLQLVGAS
jgi:predicted O-linked N-acetylglucosamine transferase (SPINDLY family)